MVKKLYSIILGQCSDEVQLLLRLYPDFEDMSTAFDGVWLMKILESLLEEIIPKKNICLQLREKY